jgi:hypothetical protein
MDPRIGWALAVAAVALGYVQYGWKGVALALSVIAFWLLLQFSRALRAMRAAGGAPIGHVPSAVMLQARLKAGMRLLDIIPLTGSLGLKLENATADAEETFCWTDASGAAVTLELARGRLLRWVLTRPPEPAEESTPATASGTDATPPPPPTGA